VGRAVSGFMLTAILLTITLMVFSRVGCANHHTPPGHEGYVRSKPIAGAGKFVGILRGPTSTGWVWRQDVINIDVRTQTYSEDMSIVTAERLNINFKAHARIRLRAGSVKDVVEKYGGPDWYKLNVREQYRSEVRAAVQSLDAFSVKNRSVEIAETVMKAMSTRYADSPIEILSVDIGEIVYPDVVVQSVVRKFVTNEDNDRKNIELKIAQREIDIGIAEAEGVADAQRIIRTTLDPMFLQYEALNAIEQMADTPNTTFVIVPYDKSGAAPMILNLDK
jgi:regulator of protease activity HflC (stomatin/prohibitin superfamily)